MLTVVSVAVLPLLAGCISLGEEKAIGLTAWHLTLPISAPRQWLLKLAVSATVATVLGLALPYLLACMTAIKTKVGLFYLMNEHDGGWSLVLLVSGLMFVMSFWAVALLANTLRAALTSAISLAALFLCAGLAIGSALLVGPLETPLLLLPVARFQLPLDFFSKIQMAKYGMLASIAIVAIVSLIQSLAQFRRAQAPRRIILKYAAILAAAVFLIAFWLADFSNSAEALRSSRLGQELSSALASLPYNRLEAPPLVWQKAALEELEQTGKLSSQTKMWLRNSSVSFAPVMTKMPHPDSAQMFMGTIEFPNGGRIGFNFQTFPPVAQKQNKTN
jgi:hypothetical protein